METTAPTKNKMPPYSILAQAGFTDEEIQGYMRPRLEQAGFSGMEINQYFEKESSKRLTRTATGQPPSNASQLLIAAAKKGYEIHASQAQASGEGKTKEITLAQAIRLGWDSSVTGIWLNKRPPEQLTEEERERQGFVKGLAGSLAAIIGDLPSYTAFGTAGGAIGMAAGGPAGGAIGGGALGMGGTEAFRAFLIECYRSGQEPSWQELWENVSNSEAIRKILLEGGKGTLIGGMTAGAGQAMKPVIRMTGLASAMEKAAPAASLLKRAEQDKDVAMAAAALNALDAAKTAQTKAAMTTAGAELLGMTAAGSAVEGEIPTAQDFVQNAALLGTMHLASKAVGKGMDSAAATLRRKRIERELDATINEISEVMQGRYVRDGSHPADEYGKAEKDPEHAAGIYAEVGENIREKGRHELADTAKGAGGAAEYHNAETPAPDYRNMERPYDALLKNHSGHIAQDPGDWTGQTIEDAKGTIQFDPNSKLATIKSPIEDVKIKAGNLKHLITENNKERKKDLHRLIAAIREPNIVTEGKRIAESGQKHLYRYYIKLFSKDGKVKTHCQIVKVCDDGTFYSTTHRLDKNFFANLLKLEDGKVIYDLAVYRTGLLPEKAGQGTVYRDNDPAKPVSDIITETTAKDKGQGTETARNGETGGIPRDKAAPAMPKGEPQPIRLTQTIRDLAEAVRIPIWQGRNSVRKGRGAKKVMGVFFGKAKGIEVKKPGDLATVAHEIGHYLEKRLFGETGSREAAAYRAELEAMATKGDGVAEGFAEFVSKYITSPEEARAKAPKFHDFFEEQAAAKEPEIYRALRKAQQDVKAYTSQSSMEEVLSHISENPQPKKSRPIWEYARDGINGFMARWADHLRPLEAITEEAERRGGITLPRNRNPYFLARLFPGRLGRARQMLEDGVYLFTGKNRTRQKVSEALKKILNDMEAAGGNQREFNAYLAAERTLELNDVKTHSEFKGNIKKELEDARDSLSRTVPTMPGGFTPTPENETIRTVKTKKNAEFPTKLSEQEKYFPEKRKGKYTISQNGIEVNFGKDAIKRGYSKDRGNVEFFKLFYNLEEAIREAKYVECEKNDGKAKHAGVVRQDIYLTSAEIDGETYVFRIKIDYKKNNKGKLYYEYAGHKTVKIKRGRSAVADLTPPESLPNISIADIRKIFNSKLEELLKLEAEHKKLEKQLAEQGYIVETGIPLEDARKTAAALRKKYEKHAKKIYRYCAAVLAYYRDAGLMSQEAYSKIRSRHKKYVPFYREFEEERPYMMGGATMTARQTVHAIKGSTRDIINPIDNIIKQTIDIVDAAERNRVNLALADLAEIPGTADIIFREEKLRTNEDGTIEPTGEALKTSMDKSEEIRCWRNGNLEVYRVDKDIAAIMHSLGKENIPGIARPLRLMAGVLRAGATVFNPVFAITNFIKDSILASISTRGQAPLLDIRDFAKAIRGAICEDETYWQYLGSGADMSGFFEQSRRSYERERKALTETNWLKRVRNRIEEKQFLEAIRAGLWDPIWDITGWAGERTERIPRLWEFIRSMRGKELTRENIEAAGFNARDITLDFARAGSSARLVNQLAAFFNANVQGLLKDADVLFMRGGKGFLKANIVLGSLGIAEALAAWDWKNGREDDYIADTNSAIRNMFFCLPFGDYIIKIPKPPGLGIVINMYRELGLQTLSKMKKQEREAAAEDIARMFWNQFEINVLPTAIMPMLEAKYNFSAFYGGPLIPKRLERQAGETQFTPYTTELAKAIGSLTAQMTDRKHSVSPILLEHFIRSYTGKVGTSVLRGADYALRKTGALPDRTEPSKDTIEKIPFVRAFFIRKRGIKSKTVDKFDTMYAAVQEKLNTLKNNPEDRKIQEAYGSWEVFDDKDLKSIYKDMYDADKDIKQIYEAPGMTADEKRQEIDRLLEHKVQAARDGIRIFKDLQNEFERLERLRSGKK